MSIPLAATAATSAFTVAAACWSRLPCVPHYASARVRVPAGVQAPARDLGAERAARTVSSPTGNRRQHVSNLPTELRSMPLDLPLFPRSNTSQSVNQRSSVPPTSPRSSRSCGVRICTGENDPNLDIRASSPATRPCTIAHLPDHHVLMSMVTGKETTTSSVFAKRRRE